MERKRDANDVIALRGRESKPALNHNSKVVECSNLTIKMKTIVTQLGEIEYFDFHFSNLSVTLFAFLGSAVVVANGANLIYILKKLSLKNVINAIALFETFANIVGFATMAGFSLLPVLHGSSERSFSCSSNALIIGILFLTGKMLNFHVTSFWVT